MKHLMNLLDTFRLRSLALAAICAAVPALAQTPATSPFPSPAPAAQPEAVPIPAAAPASAAPQAAAPKPKRKAAPPLAARLPDDPRPTLTPETLAATTRAAARYRAIVQAGGWPQAQAASPGAKGKAVATLKQRLKIEGDLTQADAAGEDYNAALAAAVKSFQKRHLLPQTGAVAGATLAAMNVSADVRARQLEAAAGRLSTSAFPFGPRYVVVNIPSASVEAVENGAIKRRYIAVAGKPDRASPAVETRVTAVNFNPAWTVPVSIIKKDIIPKMRKDPGYLAKANIRILDGGGNEVSPKAIDWTTERAAAYTLRQDSGARNALGQIRIDMPNSLAVYMHDTPSKRLFASAERFHSSGCVRVDGVRDLATWLLSERGGWDRPATDKAIAEEDFKTVRLARPVPVAWVYLTGFATPDGAAHFRNDVYELDTKGLQPGQPLQARALPAGSLY